MKLATLQVQNFRGIENSTFHFYGLTTFIGPNNTGKSTVLRAIQILLDQAKPSFEDWRGGAKEKPIEIVGTFVGIAEHERDVPGIASLVFNNEIKLRVTATIADEKVVLNYMAFAQDEQIDGWAEAWTALSPELKELAIGLDISAQTWRQKANKERVRQKIRDTKPHLISLGEAQWTDEGISIDAALKQGLPHVEIVPAVRDAQDESQLTQRKNILAEILDTEILPELQQTEQYATIVKHADELSQRMTEVGERGLPVTGQIAETLSLSAGAVLELEVLFRLDPPDISKLIGRGARIKLSDGTETSVQLQGHGAQRALVYSLVRYIAHRRSTHGDFTRSKILLFEEPELYIHPHLLRVLRQSLGTLAQQADWQVVVTTHSPVMVDVATEPRSLIIMRRTAPDKRIAHTQLLTDPFVDDEGEISERALLRASLDFHPTVCEAFFARRAVLVEGDSESAVLSFGRDALTQLAMPAHEFAATTVVSCGGKWTIAPIARLLVAFGIPCKVIHDEDRKGLTDAQLTAKPAIHPFKANARIAHIVGSDRVHVVSDTLEDVLFEAEEVKRNADKPYLAWMRAKRILEEQDLSGHARLSALFRFAFSD